MTQANSVDRPQHVSACPEGATLVIEVQSRNCERELNVFAISDEAEGAWQLRGNVRNPRSGIVARLP